MRNPSASRGVECRNSSAETLGSVGGPGYPSADDDGGGRPLTAGGETPAITRVLSAPDLADSMGLDEAATFVVDLLERPGSDIRVAEGQIGLAEDLVVPGHPDAFELRTLQRA